jgi:kynurenine formamidase
MSADPLAFALSSRYQSGTTREGGVAEQTTWVDGRVYLVFDLEMPRFQGMPIHEAHQPGYLYVLHRRHGDGWIEGVSEPRTGASGVIVCMEHSGTHIDALCHQAENQTLHGGVDAGAAATSKGFNHGSVDLIDPIVAPGVLLDIPRYRGVDEIPPGEAIGAAELQACAEAQGVSVEKGDVVLVRTGNGKHWNDPERFLAGPGVAGDGSRWLAEVGILAAGADNMAFDVLGLRDPVDGLLPGHLILLVRNGIYIIENLDLEGLAAAGHHRFTFVCTPLKFVGATGSPVRPIALVPAS